MKYSLLAIVLLIASFAWSQKTKTSNHVFAITSDKKGTFSWSEVRVIDLNTGEVVREVFNNKYSFAAFEARTNKSISVKDNQGMVKDANKLPFSTNSAACAYDRKHNRLYYTPMYINQLRYIDLNSATPRFVYFEGEALTPGNLKQEGNHITRMVIAADGHGYAISNNGDHFVRFTTGRKPEITSLGALSDDPSNTVSIRDKKTSWGGDVIADAFGGLYIISAYRHVFRIDISTRVASYAGKIEGVPANFTTNGAVIDNAGNLLVSSANSSEGYFKVDMKSWRAEKLPINQQVYNASDLASANLAFENLARQPLPRLITREIVRNNQIGLFPNPVTAGNFRVSFNGLPGVYDVRLVDLQGKTMYQKLVRVANNFQVEEMPVQSNFAQGVYLVKVLDHSRKTLFADKIFIQ